MRFPSNQLGRKVIGAATAGLLIFAIGCNGDHDPKGFFDPTATGRWQSHSLVVPILDKLDIGVEQPESEFAEATAPLPADLVPSDKDYRIAPNDMLNITVSDLMGPGVETPRQERVTESGNIMLPSIGQIPASGKTEAQLEQDIIQAYRDAKLIENAQVTVEVVESRGKVFSILGAVPHPGQYPILSNNFRVLDALVIAGDAPLGSDYLYVMRPNNIPDTTPTAATPATQPANTPAPTSTETPFNVLAPTTAPAASNSTSDDLAPPTAATEPASGDTGLTPAVTPATPATTPSNNEGNIPGGGTTDTNMVQPADGTTMPSASATDTASAPATAPAVEASSQPAAMPSAPAPATMEAATMPASMPSTMAAAPSTQPSAIEGSVVTMEGQQQQVGGPAAQPTTAPGMQLAATATTQPSDQFTFNYPAGATQYRTIRVPLGELKNGNMKYDIVIKAGDLLYIPGPAQGVYYVAGHVNRPGVYQIVGQRVTLKQAIVAAGMFDQLAIPERTEIVRRLDGDKEVFAEVNLDRIFAGEDPDIYVKANDTINVGTNILAPFIAAVRNGYRITYGFGFIYDKNFNSEAETGQHR